VTRPALLVLVVGTATDIGKTWVGGRTLVALTDRGVRVAARKPAQSFEAGDPHPTDADVLAAATGEPPEVVCPPHRSYPVPMAPPMAADALGRPAPTTADLLSELHWPTGAVDVGWLETVGGPRSPIGDDGDAVTFADRLDPDLVVLVADAGLGTVNAVLVSLAPFEGRRALVVLNRFDPADDLHARNRAWLTDRHHLDVVTTPDDVADRLTTLLSSRPAD
jgi:dethiobiotin synthetase